MLEHERWLSIAQEDLQAAQALIRVELFSTATYHCQQSAEKSLKAYLVFKNQEIIKTHDLTRLVTYCKKFDSAFEKIYEYSEYLNPFATKFRYPTEFDIPELGDAKKAIKSAQNILDFVIRQLSDNSAGQTNIFKNL